MKKTVIKGIAFVVIFVISLVVISMVANQGNGDMTAPMPAASLPTMAIVEDGQEINQMYGYTMQMDTADMRESITPIKTARQINAVVHGYGTEIAGVSYELRSIDGSRLIENTELTGTQEGDDLYLSFRLKDLMKEGEEYSLIFLVNLDESRQVRYYTRVIQADYYLTEKLDFVTSFSDATFDAEVFAEKGYAKKLEAIGIYTMGDIARCSIGKAGEYYNEALLYKLFGINAELLIDHAWGWEPCTVPSIKAYRPSENSLSSGQVLSCPYEAAKARLVLREMADQLSLELVEKGLVTDQVVLTVGYDIENLTDPARRTAYSGPVEQDRYGRRVPKAAHGTQKLDAPSSSTRRIMEAASALFDRIVDGGLLVRRMYLVAAHIVPEDEAQPEEMEQLDLFTDLATEDARREAEQAALAREKKLQETTLAIKKKFGKNAILKGMSLEEGATARERNARIGGHKA